MWRRIAILLRARLEAGRREGSPAAALLFHGLVASGTTSKQVIRMTDAKPIGYGGMLAEGTLGLMAVLAATAGFATSDEWLAHYQSWGAANGLAAKLGAFVDGGAADPEIVLKLAKRLRDAGLKVWLDRWNAPAGSPWPDRIHSAIETARGAVICRGAAEIGHWQLMEIRGFLTRSDQGVPMIPIMLPGCAGTQALSGLLGSFTAVNMMEGVSEGRIQELLRELPQPATAPARGQG